MAEKAIILPDGISVADVNEKLTAENKLGSKYRKRREEDMNENYTLYRNKVKINRLTQRQPMNIPLMKETIKTLVSKTNAPIHINFKNRDGDLDKEIYVNALWNDTAEKDLLNIKARVDKKSCYLYGRTHFALEIDPNFSNIVRFNPRDAFDLNIDPETSPWDIDTARYYSENNIFKTLNEVTTNNRFDKDARILLSEDYQGSVGKNSDAYQKKMERILAMGYYQNQGQWGQQKADSMVALQYNHTYLWDKTKKEYIRYYVVRGDEKHILRAKPYSTVFGVDFWLLEGWAEDLEASDYWSDSIADIVRIPNKALNTWISQYLENRTLHAFGMNAYDSTKDFTPKQFSPKPWAWIPMPGKPKDIYQRMDIPELKGTLEDIQFLVNIAERASATGSLEKGAVEDVKRTLGEVEIAVSNALERTNDIAPLYNSAYQRLAKKWYNLMVANMVGKREVTLYKENPDGQIKGKTISAKDIQSENGYEVQSTDKAQKDLENIDQITKLRAGRELFPNNAAMRKAERKRFMRIIDLTPQEADEIEQEELQNAEQELLQIAQPQPLLPQAPVSNPQPLPKTPTSVV